MPQMVVRRLGKKRDIDMTEGTIWKHLIAFAWPLMIGNLFQQMYNTVDSIVVGQFVGKEALAAVGSVGSIMNTLIGFFMGMSAGAGVAISQAYGSKNTKRIHDAVHTSLFLTLIMAIVFTVVGVGFVPFMLQLMNTPEDVIPGATTYLRIYFAGVIGLMFYNMGSGILRAVGDSTRPLYFLIFSAVVNTVLDLVFVVAFRMGIAGVALATIISQLLSAILTMWVLCRADGDYRVIIRDIRFDMETLKRIFNLGIPTGIQQAITAFSNVFVQGYINNFGSACMAGWSSYGKIDAFVMLPMMSIALASTTFTGQNLGAKQVERTKQGARVAWVIGEITTIVMMIPVMVFASFMIKLFNTDPDVVYYGTMFIHWMTPFYVICVFNQIFAGALRGAGETKAPMYIMLGSFVVFRQIYLFISSRLTSSALVVAFGFPLGWGLAAILTMIYYRRSGWEKKFTV